MMPATGSVTPANTTASPPAGACSLRAYECPEWAGTPSTPHNRSNTHDCPARRTPRIWPSNPQEASNRRHARIPTCPRNLRQSRRCPDSGRRALHNLPNAVLPCNAVRMKIRQHGDLQSIRLREAVHGNRFLLHLGTLVPPIMPTVASTAERTSKTTSHPVANDAEPLRPVPPQAEQNQQIQRPRHIRRQQQEKRTGKERRTATRPPAERLPAKPGRKTWGLQTNAASGI